jgi:hypothetical protein
VCVCVCVCVHRAFYRRPTDWSFLLVRSYLARALAIKADASLDDVATSEEVIEIACGDIIGMAGKAQYGADRSVPHAHTVGLLALPQPAC